MKYSKYNLLVNDEKIQEGKTLLCNTFTGATFLIDSKLRKLIEEENIDELNEEQISKFIEQGIILEDDSFDETSVIGYLHEKEKYESRVLNLTLLLTMACNLRCVYCYEGAGEVSNVSLNDEVRDGLYNFIIKEVEKKNIEYVSLCLFGGEPLLNFSDNFEFLDRIKNFCDKNQKKFSTVIVTNGILLNQTNIAALKKYNCEFIQVTLDGIKEIHDKRRIYKSGKGSFDEVVNGIKNVVSDPELSNPVIRINIDKTNLKKTVELLEYLKKENLTECSIDFGIVKGGTSACASYQGNCFSNDELGVVLEPLWQKVKELGFNYSLRPQRQNMYCGLYSDNAYTITPEGDVYKCWEHVNIKEHKMGHIDKEGNLIDLSGAFFKWMTFSPLNVKECKECKYLPLCGGGCGSVCYEKYNTYHAAGCFKIKGVFEKQLTNIFVDKIGNNQE